MDELPDEKPSVTYPRTLGYQPTAGQDPLNAWYVKSTVKGASSGPLLGKTVVLKDYVRLAGVPMMNAQPCRGCCSGSKLPARNAPASIPR